jgi:hypothetical protein
MPKQQFKRSIIVAGQRISISLEDEFWNAVAEIARQEGMLDLSWSRRSEKTVVHTISPQNFAFTFSAIIRH